MRINKIPSLYSFDPRHIVSNVEIYGKKMKVANPYTGEMIEEKQFAPDGLFSQNIFGTFETEEEYSCQCKAVTGKFYEGCMCEKCGTPVVFTEAHIDKVGWIDLTGNKYNPDGTVAERGQQWKVIKYVAYLFLEKLIGPTNLENIIHVPNIITQDGDLDEEGIKEIQDSAPECKYWYIGIKNFAEKYTEILNYYYEINNIEDQKLYDFLKDPTEVFTDKIPVISTLLRPAMRTADGLRLDKLNTIYIRIIKNNQILNSKVDQLELIQNSTLEKLQAEYFQLSEEILNNIKGKYGLIRNQICGTRVNFSARNIITPASPGIGMNEVVMPYLDFLILYQFELINVLHRVKNITIRECEMKIFNAMQEFDEEIYLIMKKVISEEECAILLNRNPTIALGSILYMKIADIKKDIHDYTLSLHNSILTVLAGDSYKPKSSDILKNIFENSLICWKTLRAHIAN